MRLAAYWTPAADSPLWRFAARWLGRDPATGEAFTPADPRHAAITEDARRYGFHATLKAPFALADGATPEQVRAAMRGLAARFTPFTTPPWVLADIDGFLALVPDPAIAAGRPPALHALADACVLALEPFRRAPGPEEIARRRPERLDPTARLHLHRYGYPWVFERFFAHLTLTCRLEGDEHARVAARLRTELAALPAAPFAFHDIALFIEDAPGAPFRLAERFPLGVQR
jgi:hypothetical protein